MKILNIKDMHDGWFIGGFEPTAYHTKDFEVNYRTHPAGQKWDMHYHTTTTEINLLVSGYYLSITLIIFTLNGKNFLFLDNISIINIIITLLILLFFNIFNKLYLGDNGSYSLGFLYSYILVNFYIQNTFVSPFFIILLLWYPGFENLFSISRRFFKKKSPLKPDTRHLHQLIYDYFKNQSFFKNKILVNNFPGILIISYNFLIMFFSTYFIQNSKILLLIIFFNILLYCCLYNSLVKK